PIAHWEVEAFEKMSAGRMMESVGHGPVQDLLLRDPTENKTDPEPPESQPAPVVSTKDSAKSSDHEHTDADAGRDMANDFLQRCLKETPVKVQRQHISGARCGEMTVPENLSLPELTDELQYEIAEARADALVNLYDELNSCWATCFPEDLEVTPAVHAPPPERFFQPFLKYGVALYEAYAKALL